MDIGASETGSGGGGSVGSPIYYSCIRIRGGKKERRRAKAKAKTKAKEERISAAWWRARGVAVS
jgi:hypothetical protein